MIDDELPPALRDLLDAERRRPGPPPDAQKRVQHALAASVTGTVGTGTGLAAKGGSLAVKGATSLATKILAGVVVASAVGAGTVAVVSRPSAPVTSPVTITMTTSSSKTTTHEPARPALVPLAPEPSKPRGVEEPKHADVRLDAHGDPHVDDKPESAPVVVAAKPVEPVVDASTLAAEEALLEQARTQLSSGHAEAALDAVHTHAQRYPDGALREEREALMTLALARSGDVAAARVHATEFVARHPRSLFRPVVEPLSH